MVAKCAPCSVFSVEKLVVAREFLGVVFELSAIRTAPVLHHVPVCPLASVAGGHEALRSACGVEAAYDVGAFLGEFRRYGALVLQSPQDYRRRVAALLHPLYEVALEALLELWRVIPYMCRELRPPQYAVLVDYLLVEQVVWLVCVAEGVEARGHHLLHPRLYLLVAEGVALSEQVFILTHAVDELRFAVEIEAFVAVASRQRP